MASSSGYVHTMLGMSMLEAIIRSECCLFIESNYSVSLKEGIENRTLSPWIYQEVQYANHLKPQLPPRLQKTYLRLFSEDGNIICENRELSREENSLKIDYNVNFSNFQEIDNTDLRMMEGKGANGLDLIYQKYFKRQQAYSSHRKNYSKILNMS